MIVGNGDIATAIREAGIDHPDVIYFASGVSNSSEKRDEMFKREQALLMQQDATRHLIYFSTLSILYSHSFYVFHKMRMEELVRDYFFGYSIIRIGNIVWGNNPNTLINFIKNKLRNRDEFTILDTYRYLISKDELIHWLKMLPKGKNKNELSITGKLVHVSQLVEDIKNGIYD